MTEGTGTGAVPGQEGGGPRARPPAAAVASGDAARSGAGGPEAAGAAIPTGGPGSRDAAGAMPGSATVTPGGGAAIPPSGPGAVTVPVTASGAGAITRPVSRSATGPDTVPDTGATSGATTGATTDAAAGPTTEPTKGETEGPFTAATTGPIKGETEGPGAGATGGTDGGPATAATTAATMGSTVGAIAPAPGPDGTSVPVPRADGADVPAPLIGGARWLASLEAEAQDLFLDELSDGEMLALPYLFDFWAMPHQLPPAGRWRSWVILGGRGAGKTRAGSEWVRSMVEGDRPLDHGRCRRVALVGETIDQVREVMIYGDSGILACSPPDRRPHWSATRKQLEWPNGAVAQVFSAHEPEGLRGPQFDAAWVDELAKWRKSRETWDMLQFALRLGDDPRVCVTTTPRNVGLLKDLLAMPSTVTTHAPTEANRAHLADSFLEEVRVRYAGSRLAQQKLDGEMLADADGALWTSDMLERGRVAAAPALDRVVVAVDPPVTGHAGSDECGIVVAGVSMRGGPGDWRAYVLEDATVHAASPAQWAEAAIAALERHGGERIVAEVNQGGDLVESVIRQVDPLVSLRKVRAARGKAARAEPVAALYEQGRVFHLPGLAALEDQLCAMTSRGYEGRGSPDRLDALVWALHELMIVPSGMHREPRVRTL